LVNITYQTPFPYPSPHPGKIIQSNPWVDWAPPSKNESHKQRAVT
jgi:hypothetical protein